MINTKKNNNHIPILSLAGVLMMPLMSIPIMPTDYRPIGALLLLIPATLYVIDYTFDRRIGKDEFTLIAFLLISLLQSAIFTGMYGLGWTAVARGIIPIALGVGCYISMKKLFEWDLEKTILYLTKTFSLVCIIGILEALAIIQIIPWGIKEAIGIGFSGLVNTRLQLTTQEASWASRILIFSIPLFLYLYKLSRQKKYIILAIANSILFLLSFSLDGIVIVLVSSLIYSLTSKQIQLESIKRITLHASILIAVFYSSFLVLSIFQEDSYFLGRITSALDNFAIDPEFIAYLDGSTFIRVFYPIIATQTFIEHPFGVGSGNFPIYFNHLIDQNYPFAFNIIEEVAANYNELSGSPKNLYTRILAEHGLFSGIFIILFIFWQLKIAIKQHRKTTTPLSTLNLQLIIISLASVIQFASFAYMFMWFSFSLNATLHKKMIDSNV